MRNDSAISVEILNIFWLVGFVIAGVSIFLVFQDKISDVAWGAIIASFVTVTGVCLTNIITSNNINKQLAHQEATFNRQLVHQIDEKDKERKLIIKHEKYFETIKYLNELEVLVRTEYIISREDIKGFVNKALDFSQVLSGIQIVASQAVLDQVICVQSLYNKLMTELIISLENLININNKIKELQQVDELWATMLKDLANKLLIVVDVNEKIQIDKHMTIIRGNATETVAEIRGFDQLRKEDIKKITEQYHEKFELISSETWKLISMMNIDLGYTRGGD
jgi:hypothetical protein